MKASWSWFHYFALFLRFRSAVSFANLVPVKSHYLVSLPRVLPPYHGRKKDETYFHFNFPRTKPSLRESDSARLGVDFYFGCTRAS